MNIKVKLALYVVLTASAITFGILFRRSYDQFMAPSGRHAASDLTDVPLKNVTGFNASQDYSHIGVFGAGFFLSVVGFGLLIGRDLSHVIAARAVKVLYDEGPDEASDPGYEEAEQEWANGNFLEAIRLLRDYLQKHPREQHAAIRIAEIYEKDLQNYLAAALEYEEVLKQKLSRQRWGWTAIHLCNLYNKLNQPEKAIALLRRIDAEYGDTPAGEKARKHLAVIDGTAEEGQPSEESPDEGPPPSGEQPPQD